MEKINLFCLPFAGGNKYSYREYEKRSPACLNIIPLEYPGRGGRVREPFVTDLHLLADDLLGRVGGSLVQGPYAIYGHSMGGLTAYLLAVRIRAGGYPPPLHLFVSGAYGPSACQQGVAGEPLHLKEKDEFISAVGELDGIPEEILADSRFIDFYEPVLRADFRLVETYCYRDAEPLDIPLTVMTGTRDPMGLSDIRLWQKETKQPVDFIGMAGGHFFIFDHIDDIMQVIADKLQL